MTKQLNIYFKCYELLPMYLTQVSCTEWALSVMTESQINWLGRHNWGIEFVRPMSKDIYLQGSYNRYFCVAVELKSGRELITAQLLFSDAHLEIVE